MSEPAAESGNAASGGSPQRRETFLARYPRNLKLGAIGFLLLVLGVLWLIGGPPSKAPAGKKIIDKHAVRIEGADKVSPAQMASGTTAAGTGREASLNDQDDHGIKMAPAPDPGLTEDSQQGSLPRMGEDGRSPWQVYARPFNTADKRPRIGVVVSGLGLSRAISDAAINRLPANVTLAFDVESPVVGAWCARARQDGHETLLAIPMEPFDYSRSDPGPNTLLTTLTNSDNLERLLWALRQSTGYVGITTFSGSRFTTDPEKLGPVLEMLKQRGLMIFDAHVAPHSAVMDLAHDMHLAAAGNVETLDSDLGPEAIDAALDRLEKTARLNGHAIAVVVPSPVMLDRLEVWLKDLPARGFALAPVSAMVQ